MQLLVGLAEVGRHLLSVGLDLALRSEATSSECLSPMSNHSSTRDGQTPEMLQLLVVAANQVIGVRVMMLCY